jgi:PiT family inorganic phosphate transporter
MSNYYYYPWNIIILAVVGSFFMAFNNGANDVANSFAASVGSKAITIKQALLISSVVTFIGAVFLGKNVTIRIIETVINKNLINYNSYQYSISMLIVLIGSSLFVFISTLLNLPVSSTHSIVGGMIGIGIINSGMKGIRWMEVFKITISWIITPIISCLFTIFLIFLFKKIIKNSKNYDSLIKNISNIISLLFIIILLILLTSLLKNKKVFKQNLINYKEVLYYSLLKKSLFLIGFITFFLLFYFLLNKIFCKILFNKNKITRKKLYFSKNNWKNRINNIFKDLQIGTSCFVAFSNGSNDIANSISPLFSIFLMLETRNFLFSNDQTFLKISNSIFLLIIVIGGLGITMGILFLGQKIMKTLGKKITKIDGIDGFSINFSVATMIFLASILGFPVSTTHAATGAVFGSGIFQDKEIHFQIINKIILSWIITVPCSSIFTIIIYKIIYLLSIF